MKKFIAFLCIAVMLCSITSVSLAANKTVRRTEQRPASGHLETVKTYVPAHYTIINNTKNDLGNGLCLVTIDIVEPSQTKNNNQTTSVLGPLMQPKRNNNIIYDQNEYDLSLLVKMGVSEAQWTPDHYKTTTIYVPEKGLTLTK